MGRLSWVAWPPPARRRSPLPLPIARIAITATTTITTSRAAPPIHQPIGALLGLLLEARVRVCPPGGCRAQLRSRRRRSRWACRSRCPGRAAAGVATARAEWRRPCRSHRPLRRSRPNCRSRRRMSDWPAAGSAPEPAPRAAARPGWGGGRGPGLAVPVAVEALSAARIGIPASLRAHDASLVGDPLSLGRRGGVPAARRTERRTPQPHHAPGMQGAESNGGVRRGGVGLQGRFGETRTRREGVAAD